MQKGSTGVVRVNLPLEREDTRLYTTGVVRVNLPLEREDTRLYTLVGSHMKSSLKGTRAEGVHGGCQG